MPDLMFHGVSAVTAEHKSYEGRTWAVLKFVELFDGKTQFNVWFDDATAARRFVDAINGAAIEPAAIMEAAE